MRKPGDVAAGSRHTCDQTEFYRIGDLDEQDRNRPGGFLQLHDLVRTGRQKDIRCRRNKLFGVTLQSDQVSFAPANVDPDVASFRPPQITKSLPERSKLGLQRSCNEHADAPHLAAARDPRQATRLPRRRAR
jgi:hypothetical protein